MDAKEALERLYPAMQDAHVQRSKFYAPRGPVKTEADADNDLDLEALSVLSAVVEDYEKARPLLEAAAKVTAQDLADGEWTRKVYPALLAALPDAPKEEK